MKQPQKQNNPADSRRVFGVPCDVFPYYAQALNFFGVRRYALTQDQSGCRLMADISGRTYRRVERKAKALLHSDKGNMRFLTRDDIDENVSGVILASEKIFFERAVL